MHDNDHHLSRRRLATPQRSRRITVLTLLTGVVATVIALTVTLGSSGASAAPTGARSQAWSAVVSARAGSCPSGRYSATRNPANPLMLATAPTNGDVLSGAPLFTAGPARGAAAGEIAELLGRDRGAPLASGLPLPGFSDRESYATFTRWVNRRLAHASPGVRRQVTLLEKIASEPTPLRLSAASGGGSPSAVNAQTHKFFCVVLQADPHTVPVITTYFLHAELGGCSSTAAINADAPRFLAQIRAMAAGIGRRPVVLFDELDAVGSTACMVHAHSIGAWEALVADEARIFEALPHTAVYIEGGYSDSNTPADAANLLRHMDIRGVQGFFTNDTHQQWTSHELRYAKAVSARLGGHVHFVINTSQNGRGPLLNPHPRYQGVESLCNPPGRGLGIPDTTASQSLNRNLDGLLWLTVPGTSSGSCNGGTPANSFWPARAEGLAARANLQLGPGFPFRPY